jgi:hypothetical protein
MKEIVGQRIVAVRQLSKREMEEQGWPTRSRYGSTAVALVLENGTVLFPSRDHEGNGPGALFGYGPSQPGFYQLWSYQLGSVIVLPKDKDGMA